MSREELASLDLENKTFGVIGVCGVVGNLVARILMDRGYSVIGTDISSKEDCRFHSSFDGYDIEIFFGGHPEEFFEKIDYIVPPPSMPKNAKVLEMLLIKALKSLSLETSLSYSHQKNLLCALVEPMERPLQQLF
jgi:UDP-N-acetylmuramate--alanine ligase